MPVFEPQGLATIIGSLPFTDPQEACSLVFKYTPDIPAWPQLPKRSFLENMYVQFSEGFPGVVIEKERIYVDRSRDLSQPLEQLYAAYLENRIDHGDTSLGAAAGLHTFLAQSEQLTKKPLAVKGQIVGPVSWGIAVTDQDRRPLLYDETLADALAKHLRLKAAWQERVLSRVSPNTIILVDEPYMSALGSAFISLSKEQAIALLGEVLAGIKGLKGIHCCANTDWSVVLQTPLDILSFDTYNYGETLRLYPAEVKDFLERGGVIAWGIVPSEEEALTRETVETLLSRLEGEMRALSQKGIPFTRIVERSLITPSCGLGSLSPEAALKALEMTAGVSREFRRQYLKL